MDGVLDAVILATGAVQRQRAAVTVRLDQREASTDFWAVSDDLTHLFAPDAGSFVRDLTLTEVALFRYAPWIESPVTVRFTPQGFRGVEQTLMRSCNVDVAAIRREQRALASQARAESLTFEANQRRVARLLPRLQEVLAADPEAQFVYGVEGDTLTRQPRLAYPKNQAIRGIELSDSTFIPIERLPVTLEASYPDGSVRTFAGDSVFVPFGEVVRVQAIVFDRRSKPIFLRGGR